MSEAEIAEAKKKMPTTYDKSTMYVNMELSKAYAKYRPMYTDELFQTIVDYCKETNPDLDLAVDVGCGPGNSTFGFAKYFKKVIGVDISATQIACAPKDVPNTEFKVGSSHELPFLQDESVDLFCSGESFQHMPQKETFAEADRVLKPGGTIAIFGYDLATSDDPEIAEIIHKLWLKIIPYMPHESTQLFERFRSIELPYPGWVRNDNLQMKLSLDAEEYMGILRSTFPHAAYIKDHPEEDFSGEISRLIAEHLEKKGQACDYSVTGIFLLMGHKPKK